ncbi:MAG: hypothetical protein OXE50_11045 [Chloroflexi bacterium]|nr:hypothetical protein [Chloroflexota bacterium]
MSTQGMSVEEMTRQMYADMYTNTPSIKSTLVKLEADVAAAVKFILFGM